jgi:hypothetical protein
MYSVSSRILTAALAAVCTLLAVALPCPAPAAVQGVSAQAGEPFATFSGVETNNVKLLHQK